MNTTLTTIRRPSPPEPQLAPRPARRLGVLDRAALHLGLALIRWGRRPGRELARYERRANGYEKNLALLQREAALAAHEDARTRAFILTVR